jgi:hypothetical protein
MTVFARVGGTHQLQLALLATSHSVCRCEANGCRQETPSFKVVRTGIGELWFSSNGTVRSSKKKVQTRPTRQSAGMAEHSPLFRVVLHFLLKNKRVALGLLSWKVMHSAANLKVHAMSPFFRLQRRCNNKR